MKQSSQQNANAVFGLLAIAILVISTYLTFSHNAIVSKINIWQVSILGNGKYFPALTIFLIAIPPLLILLGIKKGIKKNKM